ncbi:MAG: hypothetical protein OHK005_08990 [Candidatus Methylacidiphilales bacterium]
MNGANVLGWIQWSKGWVVGTALLLTFSGGARAETKVFQVGPFRFEVPDGWAHRVPDSPMRKAELRSPDGKDEAVFFFFGPGQGGSAEDNVKRWLGQVSERKEENVETETIGQTRITLVRARGTYASGMPGGPTTPVPDTLLLGAILEGSGGNVFVRMTGPAEAMKEEESAFRAMVKAAAAN